MAKPTIGVRLDDDTQARLKKLAERRDRSPHYLMKEAIDAYLAHEEAIETEKDLTAERWRAFELTGEIVAHDEVAAWAASLSRTDAE